MGLEKPRSSEDGSRSSDNIWRLMCFFLPRTACNVGLRDCLDGLKDDIPANRHMVVDGGSIDGTVELIEEYRKYFCVEILLDKSGRGKAACLPWGKKSIPEDSKDLWQHSLLFDAANRALSHWRHDFVSFRRIFSRVDNPHSGCFEELSRRFGWKHCTLVGKTDMANAIGSGM